MKIATWNVNSINVRMPQLLGWLDRTGVDVVCFQETKTVDENFPLDDLKSAGYEAAFMGQKSYNGVAIISKFPIEEIQKNYLDDATRLVDKNVKIDAAYVDARLKELSRDEDLSRYIL